jgi:hypothetical protein
MRTLQVLCCGNGEKKGQEQRKEGPRTSFYDEWVVKAPVEKLYRKVPPT